MTSPYHPIQLPALDARVNKLFETFHAKNEPEQSNEKVALALSRSGNPIDSERLAALRQGQFEDPTQETLSAIARHFGVPENYLIAADSSVAEIDAKLDLLIQARRAGIRRLDLRHGGDLDIDAIRGVITTVLGLSVGEQSLSPECLANAHLQAHHADPANLWSPKAKA